MLVLSDELLLWESSALREATMEVPAAAAEPLPAGIRDLLKGSALPDTLELSVVVTLPGILRLPTAGALPDTLASAMVAVLADTPAWSPAARPPDILA